MFFHKALTISLALCMLGGCMTVYRAKTAQEALAAKSQDSRPAAARLKEAPLRAGALKGLSLARYVDFALTNRPVMVSSALAVADARLALKQISADAPVLTSNGLNFAAINLAASGGYAAASETARHLENIGSRTDGDSSGSLSLDLLLWDAGRGDASIRAQSERVLAAEMELVNAGYTVFEEVSASYFSVLEKNALLEVALTNEFEFSEHLRRAEGMFAAGEARNLDVLRARLDLAKARELTVAASNEVRTAAAGFMHALGIEASSCDFTSVAPVMPSSLAETIGNFRLTSFSAPEAFAVAATNAPAMRLARARLRAASSEVDYAIADLMPRITASASLDWMNPLWAWNWGVRASQSLFQGFRKTAAVDRAVVSMQDAAAAVDTASRALSLDLELALAERDNSVLALATARDSLGRAKENLDTVAQQFRLGEASRVDFTDAVADYVAELGNRVTAFYRGQRAEASMFRLLGTAPLYREEKISEDKK